MASSRDDGQGVHSVGHSERARGESLALSGLGRYGGLTSFTTASEGPPEGLGQPWEGQGAHQGGRQAQELDNQEQCVPLPLRELASSLQRQLTSFPPTRAYPSPAHLPPPEAQPAKTHHSRRSPSHREAPARQLARHFIRHARELGQRGRNGRYAGQPVGRWRG